MRNPFKIGDIVKIKDTERELFKQACYDVDKTYSIGGIDGDFIHIKKYSGGWFWHRFELVSGTRIVTNCLDYKNNSDLSEDDKENITKYLEGIKDA